MATLDGLVRSGKVRYLGASSMWAWRFAKMQYVAAVNGWTTFAAMPQAHQPAIITALADETMMDGSHPSDNTHQDRTAAGDKVDKPAPQRAAAGIGRV